MELLKPLTVDFEHHLHELFLERLRKKDNTKALNFVEQYDVINNGIECNKCNEVKPVYCYGQNTRALYGIGFSNCTRCGNKSSCQFTKLLGRIKTNSNRRGMPSPEITVNDLKEMFKNQNGICPVRGEKMEPKYGDRDPLNMSPERMDNKKHYTIDNVVLICQKYQVGHHFNFSINEISSFFEYDTNDGFDFDPAIFNYNPPRHKRRLSRREGNNMLCTRCDNMLPIEMFSCKNKPWCKHCTVAWETEYVKTPHGFLKRMAKNAKQAARNRGKKLKRNDTSSNSEDNLYNFFLSIIKEQNGRCAITGIPLVYKRFHRFAASPDRLDDSKGYVKGNVRFIIAPLNTQNNK
jgi:hypothetical protein